VTTRAGEGPPALTNKAQTGARRAAHPGAASAAQVAALAALHGYEARACGRRGLTLFRCERAPPAPLPPDAQEKVGASLPFPATPTHANTFLHLSEA